MLQIFNGQVQDSDDRVLVKFGAPWCAPCKLMEPVLNELVEEGYQVVDVNTDEHEDMSIIHSVRSVPTYIVFEDGEEVSRANGMKSKDELIELMCA